MKQRIDKLRELMKKNDLSAWIIPSSDPHQSEYVAERWKSREWISGFSGSAGTVVITLNKAGLWTDSRYFLQAEHELSGSGIELFKMGLENVPTYVDWLKEELTDGDKLGFDGEVLSVAEVNTLQNGFSTKDIEFVYNADLLDKIWEDRPEIPMSQAFILEKQFSGEGRKSKINRIREKILEFHCQATLISALDDIAWTFNLRGADIDFNPVVISYAYISIDEVRLFIKEDKLPASARNILEKEGIKIFDYYEIFNFLAKLNNQTIIIDPEKLNQKLYDSISNSCDILTKQNIAFQLKCVKNKIELDGFRNAHIRDGVAMVKWLKWMEENVGKISMSEISVSDKLEEFREVGENYKGLSFSTIAGYKEHGAIVHYSATEETNKEITANGILLMDSGAQYLDGTTDITRTISLGNLDSGEKEAFTLVLKSHINLAKAIFPRGYSGAQIDSLARAALWEKGYNYGHGTGHGVGHFLNVHEGPHQIRPNNHVPLKIGMVTSNEPALYFEGQYGIRIENLIVTEKKFENEYGEFWGFETITLCPIDLKLINKSMLNNDELVWLNNYHQIVCEKLIKYLDESEKKWLLNATKQI